VIDLIPGDALQVLRSLPAGGFDALVTDPPYCSGGASEAEKSRATHQGLRSETVREGRAVWFDGDNMTTAGLCHLLREVAVECDRLLNPGGSLCVFCDWRMVSQLAPAMESAGFRLRNLVVWDKGNPGLGNGFRPQHEMILHLTRRDATFHAKDVGNVIRSKRVHHTQRQHPTEKPVDLLRQIVRVVTPPGGRVLDCFAGSGAVGVAAREEGRGAVLVERDPLHLATAAARIADGRTEIE
jgi:DNA modification methylase